MAEVAAPKQVVTEQRVLERRVVVDVRRVADLQHEAVLAVVGGVLRGCG